MVTERVADGSLRLAFGLQKKRTASEVLEREPTELGGSELLGEAPFHRGLQGLQQFLEHNSLCGVLSLSANVDSCFVIFFFIFYFVKPIYGMYEHH